MRPAIRIAAVCVAGAWVLALAATALRGEQKAADAPQPTRLSWLSPPGDPERGKTLGEVCLTCHSADSPATDPVAPKLHRQRQSYMFFALAAYRDGTRKSPIMEPMVAGKTDQDLRDIAAFVSGELHDRPPEANTTHPAYARTLRDCTWCHGETGIGEFEGMPVLAGQDPAYLAAAMEEYRTGVRGDPTMRHIAAKLTPEEERNFASYYASHEWLERHK